MTTKKRVALYSRVSTIDKQTIENQVRDLREAAQRHGWEVVAEFADKGISGAKGRNGRAGFDALCKAAMRREFESIMVWSVDRLGRSLQHLVEFLNEIQSKAVDLYLHQQGLDTATPAGKALFQMCGVFAEFERSMIRERVLAGVRRARAAGHQLGRKPLEQTDGKTVEKIYTLRRHGMGMKKIAKEVGVSSRTVWRLLQEEDKAT